MKKYLLSITASVLLVAGGLLLADGCWIRAKAVLAQYLLQNAFQETIRTGKLTKAWPWADTWPVARLRMERLDVDLIVLEGEHGEVLAFGPGHVPTSSGPAVIGTVCWLDIGTAVSHFCSICSQVISSACRPGTERCSISVCVRAVFMPPIPSILMKAIRQV